MIVSNTTLRSDPPAECPFLTASAEAGREPRNSDRYTLLPFVTPQTSSGDGIAVFDGQSADGFRDDSIWKENEMKFTEGEKAVAGIALALMFLFGSGSVL